MPGKEVELTGICPVPCPSRYWFRATSTLVRLSQPACTALLAWSLTVHIPQKSSPSAATQRGVQYRTPRMRFPNPTPSVPRHSLGYSPHLERAIPILRDWLHPFPLPAFSCSGCKELVVVTHTHTHTHTHTFPTAHTHTHTLFPYCLPCESGSVVSDSLQPHGLYSPWNSPGQNTRVGSCSLLQGIFPTQGSNSGLLRCRQSVYQLSHQGSPLL